MTRRSGGINSNGGKEGNPPHNAPKEEYNYTIIAPIHFYFRVASVLGSELFYIVFLPLIIWQVDYQLGRIAIIFWNVLFFVGNAMKVGKQGRREAKGRASRRLAEQKCMVESTHYLNSIISIHCPVRKQDLLCLPRPLDPPVLCLEKEYSAEYVGRSEEWKEDGRE